MSDARQDLQGRSDVETLVRAFYTKATKDEIIGHFFTSVIPIDWDHHFPRMFDFWESVLFGGSYRGNAMEPHIRLNKLSPMKEEHFDRWMKLFTETVDENFAGRKAEEAKQRAGSIAALMLHKVHHS